MLLKDKVCLITGGAAGIGKATALKFAKEGAKVVLCDVDQEAGESLAKELGNGAVFYKVDVTNRDAVQEWVDDVIDKFGRVDVLVNNAGITRDGLFVKYKNGEVVSQMSEQDFDLVIKVNLKGVFNCAQAVTPQMIKQGGGVILNASSIVGLYGNFGQTNYAATKFGVIGMTKTWSRELGRYNIRRERGLPRLHPDGNGAEDARENPRRPGRQNFPWVGWVSRKMLLTFTPGWPVMKLPIFPAQRSALMVGWSSVHKQISQNQIKSPP